MKVFLNFFIFILMILNAVVLARNHSGCLINLANDIKGFAPVILTAPKRKYYQLFRPTGLVTSLKKGTKLLLVCSGNKNVFANTTFDALQLKCVGGSFVDSNNNVQPLSQLACKSIPSSTLRITRNVCSHGKGFIYESGFKIGNLFYGPVFEICYNNLTEHTFYTHNILNGVAIKCEYVHPNWMPLIAIPCDRNIYKTCLSFQRNEIWHYILFLLPLINLFPTKADTYSVSENTRRGFAADGMQFNTAKVNNFYTKKNQIYRFEKLLGPGQIYLDEKNFLARGHLTPDADFVLPYEQLATYYYVNIGPEFQAVNAGNWLRVEELARTIAASFQDDIESYNGYMGVLALPNNSDVLVDIYLDDKKKIEVPKYYFKVLLHRANKSAIVFVSANNPYINNGANEEICTNMCKEAGLEHVNFSDVTKGYTFCCKLNEFKFIIDPRWLTPNEVKASKLLKRKEIKEDHKRKYTRRNSTTI